MKTWAGKPVSDLFARIKSTMPPGAAGIVADPVYASIVAYVFDNYGLEAGSTPLPVDMASLATLQIPGSHTLEVYEGDWSGGIAPGATLPPWPSRHSPLEHIASVTDDLLKNPPDGSWLSWRRTQDAGGFSPLTQINNHNARRLRVAWSMTLPPGPNESTPLVHDGVLFLQSFGDHVQAFDAATGDELWHYSRELPKGASPTVHRNMALYEDKVIATTSDVRVIALEAKTGKLVWEQPIGDWAGDELTLVTGGPLVVNGVVMQGTSGSRPGGQYIAALDAATGKPLWRFNSIAQPGEPHGDSWNGLPLEKRTGGSVWTSGSYDAKRGLALFGPAPTYDTGPMRDPVGKRGVTNDALYTDSTLALDPRTGRLVWHYQHLSNDQWDFDWAFERQIVQLPVNGRSRRVIVTAGKQAIYDALDADSGQYLFSMDLGLQNVVTSIDPRTGRKVIDPKLLPGAGRTATVCPHTSGGRNWLPASYNPLIFNLYVPLVESCMDLIPMPKGEHGLLSTGVRQTLRPPPGSDGKYGRLQAINLTTRKTVWTVRQRAPQTTGVLATAGDVVFAGALDRWFTAYDARSGASLWKTQLNDVSISTPITYSVGGTQFVAIVAGGGFGQSTTFPPIVPEISLPSIRSATLWVFSLED